MDKVALTAGAFRIVSLFHLWIVCPVHGRYHASDCGGGSFHRILPSLRARGGRISSRFGGGRDDDRRRAARAGRAVPGGCVKAPAAPAVRSPALLAWDE